MSDREQARHAFDTAILEAERSTYALSLIDTQRADEQQELAELAKKARVEASYENLTNLQLGLLRAVHAIAGKVGPAPIPHPKLTFGRDEQGGADARKAINAMAQTASVHERGSPYDKKARLNARAARDLAQLAEVAFDGWSQEIGPNWQQGLDIAAKVLDYAELTLNGGNLNVVAWQKQRDEGLGAWKGVVPAGEFVKSDRPNSGAAQEIEVHPVVGDCVDGYLVVEGEDNVLALIDSPDEAVEFAHAHLSRGDSEGSVAVVGAKLSITDAQTITIFHAPSQENAPHEDGPSP